MRWLLALASSFLLLAGCAADQSERQPPRPFWFQQSDFTRPGNASTWKQDDPPLSVCGEILGGVLKMIAPKY